MSNRFLFVACYYNMSRHLTQMLMSIGAQSYKSWKIVIVEDMSDVHEMQEAIAITDAFRNLTAQDQVVLKVNHEKKYEIRNVLESVRKHARPDDIVCRIDCDDYLCDNDALARINEVYEKHPECEALWTAHRWIDTADAVDRVTDVNISRPLTDPDPYKSEWVSSHLKTFRAGVLDRISEENFKGSTGDYSHTAGDQTLYLPILHKARTKGYLPLVTYAYRCNMATANFYTDYALDQKAEAEFIRKRGFIE